MSFLEALAMGKAVVAADSEKVDREWDQGRLRGAGTHEENTSIDFFRQVL